MLVRTCSGNNRHNNIESNTVVVMVSITSDENVCIVRPTTAHNRGEVLEPTRGDAGTTLRCTVLGPTR